MPQIDHIQLPSGSVYEIVDTVARSQTVGAIRLRGTTTTALTDGAETNPIQINDEDFTAIANDAVFYSNKEFVFDGTYWHEFGDMTGLGSLATQNSASGQFTPHGTVSQPSFTGSELTSTGTFTPTGSIAVADSGDGTSYTPQGSVSAPTISVASEGATASVTPFGTAGTIPSLGMTVTNGTLTITWDAGTLPTAGTAVTVKTGDATYQASQPSFTGTEKKFSFSGTSGNVSVTGTPAGTVSQPTFTGTQETITVS